MIREVEKWRRRSRNNSREKMPGRQAILLSAYGQNAKSSFLALPTLLTKVPQIAQLDVEPMRVRGGAAQLSIFNLSFRQRRALFGPMHQLPGRSGGKRGSCDISVSQKFLSGAQPQ
jgi:hypothetical protein